MVMYIGIEKIEPGCYALFKIGGVYSTYVNAYDRFGRINLETEEKLGRKTTLALYF